MPQNAVVSIVIAGSTSAYVVMNTTTAAVMLTALVKSCLVLRFLNILRIFSKSFFILSVPPHGVIATALKILYSKTETCRSRHSPKVRQRLRMLKQMIPLFSFGFH